MSWKTYLGIRAKFETYGREETFYASMKLVSTLMAVHYSSRALIKSFIEEVKPVDVINNVMTLMYFIHHLQGLWTIIQKEWGLMKAEDMKNRVLSRQISLQGMLIG